MDTYDIDYMVGIVEELAIVKKWEAEAKSDFQKLAYSEDGEDQAWRMEIRGQVLPQAERDITALFKKAQEAGLENQWPVIIVKAEENALRL